MATTRAFMRSPSWAWRRRSGPTRRGGCCRSRWSRSLSSSCRRISSPSRSSSRLATWRRPWSMRVRRLETTTAAAAAAGAGSHRPRRSSRSPSRPWLFFGPTGRRPIVTGKDGAPVGARPGGDLHDGRRRGLAAAHRLSSTPFISTGSRSRPRASPSSSKRRARSASPRAGSEAKRRGARAAGRRRRLARGRRLLPLGRQAPADRSGVGTRRPRHATRAPIPGATTRRAAARARFATSASGPYQGGLAPVGSHAAGQSGEGDPRSRRQRQRMGGRLVSRRASRAATCAIRKAPQSGSGRGIRGGGWQEPAERLRAAKRFHGRARHRAPRTSAFAARGTRASDRRADLRPGSLPSRRRPICVSHS